MAWMINQRRIRAHRLLVVQHLVRLPRVLRARDLAVPRRKCLVLPDLTLLAQALALPVRVLPLAPPELMLPSLQLLTVLLVMLRRIARAT